MRVSAYFDDSTREGNYSGEVAGWTDTHYAWCYRYAPQSTTPQREWIAGLVKSCQRAWEAGRYIHLSLNMQEQDPAAKTPLRDVLTALSPFWPKIVALEMADEPRWSRAATDANASELRGIVTALGLSQRPLLVVYSTAQFPGAPISALDGVGIEAYVDLPGSPVSSVNQKWLRGYLSKAMGAVPASKEIHLVPMAYARNGDWLDFKNLVKGSAEYKNAVQTLVDLQDVAFEAAKSDPRVVSLNMFSWGRASGAREIALLGLACKRIGRAALALDSSPPPEPPPPEPPPPGGSMNEADRIEVEKLLALATAEAAAADAWLEAHPPAGEGGAITKPLLTQGTRFIDGATGKQVRLMGAISCCEGAKQGGGWPWVSEAFMKRVKAHGGNHVTVRLGPNAGQEPLTTLYDGDPTKYAFDAYVNKRVPGQAPYYPLEFDPAFWARLRKTLRIAQNLGLYVEVSVIDGWALRHRWPPWEANWSDIMGSAPKTHHKTWIEKVARETGSFPNVIYLCGNENFLPPGKVTLAWEGTIADILHGQPRHLVGTNSHNSEIERNGALDFVVLHGDIAVPPKWNKPLYMNEAGPRLTAVQFAAEAKKARNLGSEFLLWRGDMLDAEFERALDEMKKLQGAA